MRASAVAVVLLAAAPLQAQETTDYVVADYELTIEPRSGTASARVTLDITYDIRSGTKTEGFKYVGTNRVSDVRGDSGDGLPVTTTVERQRETRIGWRFPPAGRGTKHVRIRFTLRNALDGELAAGVLDAPWAGVFMVPVRRAVYRLLLPDGWRGDARAPGALTTSFGGRPAIEVVQSPLRQTSFSATLGSGLNRPGRSGRNGGGDAVVGILSLAVFAAFAGFVFIAVRTVKRANGQRAWGTSSCGGGSSCSSGCGGGGCGGGCGG